MKGMPIAVAPVVRTLMMECAVFAQLGNFN